MAIKNEQGFSLLETVMATAVLSIGLLSLIGMFSAGYNALDGGNHRTLAAKLARNKMEELRASPPVAVEMTENTSGMERHWLIEKSLDPKNPNIWVITVDVSWKNLKGQRRELQLKSFRLS